MKTFPSERSVQLFLAFALLLNIVFWFSVRDIRQEWGNVPPAPELKYAASYGVGDSSFSYRLNGLMVQNLGDTGGRVTALKDYDYDSLAQWFFVQDSLDPHSSYMPYLAAYYFSAVQNPEKFRPIIDYLKEVGQRPEGEKWRWLAQAVFMARFKMNDMDLALELAEVLAQSEAEDVPAWARQMPVFVLNAKGNKMGAYALMLQILKTGADKMHPNEISEMKKYICTRILDKEDARDNPLCVEQWL